MRVRCCLFLALVLCLPSGQAQEPELTLDDEFLQSAERWARDNLDSDGLAVLQNLDREKVKRFFKDLQTHFHGRYVIDLAGLRDSAQAIAPLLETYEETLPYALWLKTRLDYLDVANELRLTIPQPKIAPGPPPKSLANPGPEKEREIWITKIVKDWPSVSKPYIPRLKPIFAAQKLPVQLVWLAELESSFDPRARSPAGAAGLFQLMPGTANRYGLRTWPLDERLNPEMCAQAAAQCLDHLHAQFRDWRLTLAAYNAGAGTVQNLLTRRKAHAFDEIADSLPAETQLYVPKFEAILLRREGLRIRDLHGPLPERAKDKP